MCVVDYDSHEIANHEEVIVAAKNMEGEMQRWVAGLLPAMRKSA